MKPVLKKKRYLLLVLVPVFLVLIVLAPFLLSTSPALHYFTSVLNRKIPGTISVESWLVGWQEGILCQNIEYRNPEKGIRVTAPSVTTNRGLLAILMAPRNLGRVHVDSPVAELPGSAVQRFFSEGVVTADHAAKRSPAGDSPFWEDLFIELKIRNGRVNLLWTESGKSVDLTKISADSTLSAGINDFAVSFYTFDQGLVDIAGSLNLPAHEQGWLETVTLDTAVTLQALPMKDLLSIGAGKGNLPQGDGQLDADFQLKTVGTDILEISGYAELTDAAFSGGFLGEDHPYFQRFHLAVSEGSLTGRGWSFKEFDLAADTLDLQASGEKTTDTLRLTAGGNLNLPVLFDQFPRLLRVNESTLLESGLVDFSVEIAGTNPDLDVKLKVKTDTIGGIFQDQHFSWDSPLSVLFNGEKNGSSIQISALRVNTPFAWIKGSGGLPDFGLDAEVDLDRAFVDLGTLFEFDWQGGGLLELKMRNGIAEGIRGRFGVDTEMSISNFSLTRQDIPVIPLHQLSLIGNASIPDNFLGDPNGEYDFQVVLSSWLGEIFFVLNGDKFQDKPFTGFYTTDAEIELEQLDTLLESLAVLDDTREISGTMQLQAAGFTRGKATELRNFSAEVAGFSFQGNGSTVTDSQFRINIEEPLDEETPFLAIHELEVASGEQAYQRSGEGLNLIDPAAGRIILHDVVCAGESGKIHLESLVLPNWRDPSEDIQFDFSVASLDMAQVSRWSQAFGLMPEHTLLDGSAEGRFSLTDAELPAKTLEAEATVIDFGLRRRDAQYIAGDELAFSTSIQGTIPFGEAKIETLRLHSDALDLDAAGRIVVDGDIQLVELSGNMQPSLEKVGFILSSEFDTDLEMAGRPQEEIRIRYPLWGAIDANLGRIGISSSLHAESLQWKGINLQEVNLPFRFEDRRLLLDVSAILNGGKFALATNTDFTLDPPVIKSKAESRIMTGVGLDEPLVDQVLSRIHPLFGGLADTSGTIDMRLDSLWWPIGDQAKNEANFVFIIGAEDLEVEGKKPLLDILSPFGLAKEKLQLEDKEIYCIGRNGWIKCSPLRLAAGDEELLLTGRVLMDQTLEYEVEVPVTRQLVSDEEYQQLSDQAVVVIINGTTDQPTYDQEKFRTNLQELKEKAGQKPGADTGRSSAGADNG